MRYGAIRWTRGLAWVCLALAPGALLADVVHLRGGGKITGEIVAMTDTTVKVDIGAGEMTVRMSTVESITRGSSPLREYRQQAKTLAPEDVEGWRALGRWATQQGLGRQARDAFNHVLAVSPGDPEANEAVGRVWFDGRWMSAEESYLAQGYVDFENQWVLPEERQAILDDRRAEEEAERQEIAAQIEQEDADRAVREQERADADAQFWAGSELPAGGMVYWDVGMAPSLWPDQPALDGGLP
jgi:hypothetical protein